MTSRCWWVIAEEDLIAALTRTHGGEDPDVVYAELYANGTRDDEPDDGEMIAGD